MNHNKQDEPALPSSLEEKLDQALYISDSTQGFLNWITTASFASIAFLFSILLQQKTADQLDSKILPTLVIILFTISSAIGIYTRTDFALSKTMKWFIQTYEELVQYAKKLNTENWQKHPATLSKMETENLSILKNDFKRRALLTVISILCFSAGAILEFIYLYFTIII